MRLAILSDIHGNLLALEAVLADLAARGGADEVVVAGDLCLDGPWPAEALARVRALGCAVIQGNTDRDLAAAADGDTAAEDEHKALFAWTREQLGAEELAYLRDLPFSHRVAAPGGASAVLIVHANPRDLDTHLRPYAPESDILPLLADVPDDVAVVAFGHLHIPYTRRVGRLMLADVASVGLPKDGDRRAGYALLTWRDDGWQIEQRRVEYPVDQAVAHLREIDPPGAAALVRTLLRARYPDMVKARGGRAPRTATPPARAGGAAARPAADTQAPMPAPPATSPAAESPLVAKSIEAGPETPAASGPDPTVEASAPPTEAAPSASPAPTVTAALADVPASKEESEEHGDAGGTPDGPVGAPPGGPDPRERFERAIRRIVVERVVVMTALIEAVRAGDDADAVHDMRVASRRLRAALAAAEAVAPPKQWRRLSRSVRDLTRALGAVRDDDVMLALLQRRLRAAKTAEHPSLARLIAEIEAKQVAKRHALTKVLDRWHDDDLAGQFRRFTGAPADTAGSPSAEGAG